MPLAVSDLERQRRTAYSGRAMPSHLSSHRYRRRSDLIVRLAGAFLIGVAWLAIRMLVARDAQPRPDALALLGLAGAGFVATSLGAALLTLGHHVFDTIMVSARWEPRPLPPLQHCDVSPTPMADTAAGGLPDKDEAGWHDVATNTGPLAFLNPVTPDQVFRR